MKRNKFTRRIIFILLLSILLVSCGTIPQDGIRQVQLDMTKQEVIKKMGDNYQVVSMVKTNQGEQEILRYTPYTIAAQNERVVPNYYYYLHFLDGKLVEISHEDIRPPYMDHPHH